MGALRKVSSVPDTKKTTFSLYMCIVVVSKVRIDSFCYNNGTDKMVYFLYIQHVYHGSSEVFPPPSHSGTLRQPIPQALLGANLREERGFHTLAFKWSCSEVLLTTHCLLIRTSHIASSNHRGTRKYNPTMCLEGRRIRNVSKTALMAIMSNPDIKEKKINYHIALFHFRN